MPVCQPANRHQQFLLLCSVQHGDTRSLLLRYINDSHAVDSWCGEVRIHTAAGGDGWGGLNPWRVIVMSWRLCKSRALWWGGFKLVREKYGQHRLAIKTQKESASTVCDDILTCLPAYADWFSLRVCRKANCMLRHLMYYRDQLHCFCLSECRKTTDNVNHTHCHGQ
jgi:hypothetical protein